MDNLEQSIPPRILAIAQHLYPELSQSPEWLRRVDADIVSGYLAQIETPLYDDWIGLLLRTLDPREGDSVRVYLDIQKFRTRVTDSAQAEQSDELQWLLREVDGWLRRRDTDMILGLDEGPPHPFFRDLMRRLESDPEYRRLSKRKTARPTDVDFERLPGALWDFARQVTGLESAGLKFWNAMRDHIYPHFVAEALELTPYREFLALAIRHYGLGQTQAILPQVQALRDRLVATPDLIDPLDVRRTGIDATVLQMKCDDLLDRLRHGGPDGRKFRPAR